MSTTEERARAELEQAARDYLAALPEREDETLPPEHVYAHETGRVRVRPMYGAVVYLGWGPRYVNMDGHELDADPLTINGREYDGMSVWVYPDGQVETGFDGRHLTDSARRKLPELAREILADWSADHPDTVRAHLAACEAHERNRDRARRVGAAELVLKNLAELA